VTYWDFSAAWRLREFIERIPNWAIPLAFLWVRGPGRSRREWFS